MPCEPLPIGQVLGDRFEVRDILGRGGFGIAYVALDTARDDDVVVKELAPEGSRRLAHGVLDLASGSSPAQRLRQRFLDEARLISKVHARGVLPVRASFSENGTAYYVTEFVPGSETLERVLQREGRLDVDGALDIFLALLDVVQLVHEKGILHRDIKPSNVLVTNRGETILIDFGAAREFHADSAMTHTVMFTPGYAPPEQLSERAKRGPATDLYALAATLYHMLAGEPPPDAAERMSGVPIRLIAEIRPDVDPAVAAAIELTLSLKYAERPQNAEELRVILAAEPELGRDFSYSDLDWMLAQSRTFTFSKRACPCCDGVLTEVRALRKNACPVCRKGLVRRRRIDLDLCPKCRIGALISMSNEPNLAVCPACSKGLLVYKRKALIGSTKVVRCPKCEAGFELKDGILASIQTGEGLTPVEWLERSGRSSAFWCCRECKAQFDVEADGRMSQVEPPPAGKYRALYPEEWAQVAAGLEPGTGNAECDTCGADFYCEEDRLTLIGTFEDPYRFGAEYAGRLINVEDARWFAVGKISPAPGLVCDKCGLEFDAAGEYLRLVRSTDRKLARHEGEPRMLEDWHRLAGGLPTRDQEAEVDSKLEQVLRQGYWDGGFGFDSQNRVAWKGEAVRVSDSLRSTLVVQDSELSFGSLFRKWRAPVDAVTGCRGDATHLSLLLNGTPDWLSFEVSPVELTVHLESGDRKLLVTAQDLAARLDGERSV